MRRLLGMCILGLGLLLQHAELATGRPVSEEPAAAEPAPPRQAPLQCFYCLFMRARGDVGKSERAAWMTTLDGCTQCKLWAFNATDRTARPDGPPPPGTYAVAHTHPASTEFSPADRRFARTFRLQLYLIHRKGIWVYDPVLDRETKLQGSDWLDRLGDDRDRACTAMFRKPRVQKRARQVVDPAECPKV